MHYRMAHSKFFDITTLVVFCTLRLSCGVVNMHGDYFDDAAHHCGHWFCDDPETSKRLGLLFDIAVWGTVFGT